jgi:secreted trypsin-like serine protease
MRFLLTLLAAGLVFAAPAGAVSGVKKANPAGVPFIAALANGCTGTLIAPDRVLTAGHCLDGFAATDFRVHIGAARNDGATDGGIPVRGFAVHPRFKESFPFAHKSPQNAIALYDVGIILLAQPVTGVAPVKLGTPADETVGETGSLFGYGITDTSVSNRALRGGDMKVISASRCANAYPKAIIASEICGLDSKSTHAPFIQACPGDSGGPFLKHTPAGPVEIGITSWGPEVKAAKCGARQLPGVYMRVSSFLDFITGPDPVIEPFPTGDTPYATVTGDAKVGATLTCNAPPLGGSPATLSYRWIWNNEVISRKATATAIPAMRGRSVGCTVTARNAGGHVDMFTPRVGRLVIRSLHERAEFERA